MACPTRVVAVSITAGSATRRRARLPVPAPAFESTMFTLTLPYPPSINHAFSVIRGRPVLSQQTRAFRQRVRGLVRSAGIPTLLGPVAVRLELHPPDDRRRDCDNAQKSLLDALTQAGAFVDDSQIVWLLTIKTPASAAGRAIVIASSLPDDPFPSCGLEPTHAFPQQ